MAWHILDTGSIWLKEFAAALQNLAPTTNWCPEYRNLGHWENWERTERLPDPSIGLNYFPLQRGYARFPVSRFLPFQKALTQRLLKASPQPQETGLICTAPFYAPVAQQWPGPVVYYLTDLTKEYAGMNRRLIVELDTQMCQSAGAVCPNSDRIADYLIKEAGCSEAKITVIPNATRQRNVLERPSLQPAALPSDLAGLPRPLVGVIGNLAGNMDWPLIRGAVDRLPDLSWVFVGPTDMKIPDAEQERQRQALLSRGGRVRFLGHKPYGELCRYAQSFDAALLPYRKKEPTYSGSATRFYEHLAACRPILATRGFHELLSKEPLLKLVDTTEDLVRALQDLQAVHFQDGFEDLRWRASKQGTWAVRARDLLTAANQACGLKVA